MALLVVGKITTPPNLSPSEDEFDVYPRFIIDLRGTFICQNHSNYSNLTRYMNKSYLWNSDLKKFHCFNCQHYQTNRCYFPKNDIDNLERARKKNTIKCNICQTQIHQIGTILNAEYNRSFCESNPLLCCVCETHLRKSPKRVSGTKIALIHLFCLIASSYYLISYFTTLFLFDSIGFLIFLPPFLFWGAIIIYNIRSIAAVIRGKRKFHGFLESNRNKSGPYQMYIDNNNLPNSIQYYYPVGEIYQILSNQIRQLELLPDTEQNSELKYLRQKRAMIPLQQRW